MLAVPAVTALIGAVRYPDLRVVATHRSAEGLADRHEAGSVYTVFGLISAQIMIVLAVLVAAASAWLAGAGRRTAMAMLATAACTNLALLTGSLIMWGLIAPSPTGLAATAVPAAAGVLGLLAPAHRRSA